MSESTPAPVAGHAAEHAAPALTPDAIETVLGDFRTWLEILAAQEDAPALLNGSVPEASLDLHTLVAQFTALRHEVNLQTKAVRAQQEQNAETLRQLGQAVEALHEAPAKPADDELLRPLLKTLTDIADALALGRQEVERLQTSTQPALARLQTAPEAPRSFWARWFGAEAPESAADRRKAAVQAQQMLDSVLTGYGMSLQRVERAVQQQGLEPMAATGQRFDPERMEVVEAVADSGKPSGEVIAEVRRGYLWQDRVFRYAQVRVAK